MPTFSIYNVSPYNGATSYSLHDIVVYQNRYYYSLKYSNTSVPTAVTSWGGYKSYQTPYGNPVAAPDFFWIPNYTSEIENKASVTIVKFGDGYEQRTPDGINNSLIKLNLTFEGRSERETRAIVHFLNARKGTEPFFFANAFPYNYDSVSQNHPKKFIAEEFTIRSVYYDNYTISAKFIETTNI